MHEFRIGRDLGTSSDFVSQNRSHPGKDSLLFVLPWQNRSSQSWERIYVEDPIETLEKPAFKGGGGRWARTTDFRKYYSRWFFVFLLKLKHAYGFLIYCIF